MKYSIPFNKPFQELNGNWNNFLKHPLLDYPIWLPTGKSISFPGMQFPRVARVYDTQLWFARNEEGLAIDYSELQMDPNFHGTMHETPVYLCEVYCDGGSDGHLDLFLWGWMFVDGTAFEKAYEETNGRAIGALSPFVRDDLMCDRTGWKK